MSAASARLLRVALISVFVWSALVLLLAEAGMGGRYALHPDDPGRVEPLPEIALNRAESQLKPFADYAVIGERPLFNPDRRPQPSDAAPATVADAPAAPVELDLVLTSVIIAGDTRIAVVAQANGENPQSVKLGQALAGQQSSWKLVELQPRQAVFEGPGGRSQVGLRVFDGVGGQAPTPVSVDSGTVQVETTENAQPGEEQTPEQRADMIRKRIEERRRQMREEAARANQERGK